MQGVYLFFNKTQRNHRRALSLGFLLPLIPIPLLATLDYKLAVGWFSFFALLIAYSMYRRAIGQELVIAFLFALFVTSYHPYVYDSTNFFLGHVNLYPLILWTAGLVLLREVYERLQIAYRWVIACVLYLGGLFVIEYVGYYLLEIHLNGNFPSLFGLGIIHGTFFIYFFYMLAGPLYLLVTDYLEVR